jgi:hypothetical protein
MTRECHVQFCERLTVKFPGSTYHRSLIVLFLFDCSLGAKKPSANSQLIPTAQRNDKLVIYANAVT